MPSIRQSFAAVFLMGAIAASATTLAATPSFNCAQATTAVEELLCADDGLARQDRLLAAVYKRALERLDADGIARLRAEQRAWARGRAEACPPDRPDAAQCLTNVYEARIAAVRPLSFDDLRLYPGVEVQAERRAPLACLRFDAPLAPDQAAAIESYLESAGGERLAARMNGDTLCVEGLAHGETHSLTVKQGLAGEGAVLRADVTVDVEIPDRPRRIVFPSRGLILPRVDVAGLPIETVNVERVRALLLRVDDKQVTEGLRLGLVERQISYSDVGRLASRLGQNVWTGEIEIEAKRNQSVRTLIPIAEVAPDLKPGVYLAVAEDPEARVDEGWWVSSQWFVVSDIGITTFIGVDGLTVAARSLATAAPAAGARVALAAGDGDILAEAIADADGLARIAPGYLNGDGDDAPRAVYAYGEAGDFVYVDLTRAPLDLSDRGVDGRPAPGALDAYLKPERGVYRPGEPVRLTAILRDAAAVAVEGLPLTLKVIRYDGLEVFRRVLHDKGAGGYSTEISLPPSAATGMWRATLHADPDGAAIGRTRFLVEDFVPPRIEALLDARIDGPTLKADLSANYLYGAPAAHLPGEAVIDVRPAAGPAEGYRIGRVQEAKPHSYRAALQRFETDADGQARIDIGVGDWPGTTYPLEAHIRASLFDAGGRPINVSQTVPLPNLPLFVGIKPIFEDERIKTGGVAAFDIQAFNADGEGVARRLEYSIVREDVDYIWFRSGERWDYRVQYLDVETLDAGEVAAAADAPARVERRFEDWRAYRIDVRDAESGMASSMRFRAGWYGAATAGAEPAPDKVKVTLPPGPFRPGQTVTAHIEPPFDAQVLATVVDGRLSEAASATVPAAGGELTVTLPAAGASGAYILVNAFAKADGERSLAPRRAIGAAYAAYDPLPKSIDVALVAPAETEPSRTVDVAIDLVGAEGPTFVTLAAVDDGVLGLTGYKAPDPKRHFLGKRRLGLELRDIFGQVIDAAGAVVGRVRSGGDEESGRNAASADLPKKTVKVVSLFSGVVEAGPDGKAIAPLRLPEFSGRLRLMAQAWSTTKVGSAEATMLVRRPVVAEIGMPRFLAPGDKASLTLSLGNVSGPKGIYEAKLTATGPLSIPPGSGISTELAPTDLAALTTIEISALEPGDGALRLDVTGPGGIAFSVERNLTVRPPAPIETRSHMATIAPGGEMTAPPGLTADLYASTARITTAINPLPDLGLPSILPSLAGYPYGCAEQTTSKALPMLYVEGVAKAMGLYAGRDAKAVAAAGVARLLGMQVYSGGFGFWDASYETRPWITVYVTDFLVAAKAAGADVPAKPLARALDRLSVIVDGTLRSGRDWETSAYALYVRARAGVADPARVRRFAEQAGAGQRTGLALAFVGGALGAVGDDGAARTMFVNSQAAGLGDFRGAYWTYGGPVRDRALRLALMAETGAIDWPALEAEAKALSEAVRGARWLSTQTKAWIVRAASALGAAAGDIDGLPGLGLYEQASFGGPLTLRNPSAREVTGVISVSGAASTPQAALGSGFNVRRAYFSAAGDRIDPTKVRQNDLVVVVLTGEQPEPGRSRALLVDYLPAGLELENAKLGGGDLGAYGWLGRLTPTVHQELRDDRFVTAFSSAGNSAFRVAYLARAVTLGNFVHGGARIEAMYHPNRFGRAASTTVVVGGR